MSSDQSFGRRNRKITAVPSPAALLPEPAQPPSEARKLVIFGIGVLVSMFAAAGLLVLLIAINSPTPPATPTSPVILSTMYVVTDRAPRHTCADESCGMVGDLFVRQKVDVYEKLGRWARITAPYDASCVDGRSEYVDARNDQCNSGNGIVDGQFAEWIALDRLSLTPPADPAAGKSPLAGAMARSDDYGTHGTRFEAAAAKAIQEGLCTEEQLIASGGWMASQSYAPKTVYFTFCGERRVWINVAKLSVVKYED